MRRRKVRTIHRRGTRHGGPISLLRSVVLALLATVCIGLGIAAPLGAQDDSGTGPVHVIEISGTIDLGLAPYLQREIEEAENANASAIILDIDTPGGRLDAVLQMNDTLLDATIPTIAFVNRTAFSAGALIAISCERVYMVPGAVMGAATPVDGGGNTASEKTISAVRSTFKSTAEVRGRDPIVAEAMVDPAVEVPGLDGPESLLTLTTTDAANFGYADGVVSSIDELVAALGLQGAEIRYSSPGPAEQLVRFITNPVVASLLIIGAILLIIGDLVVAGLGPIGVVGGIMLILFFWGHMIAGLAGWEDLALVALGLVLLGIEAFVIPGFGIAGISGLILMGVGFWMAMISRDYRVTGGGERAAWTVIAAFVAVIAGAFIILSLLPKSRRFTGLVLQGDGGAVSANRPVGRWLSMFGGGNELVLPPENPIRLPLRPPTERMTGRTGVALTDLRPSGTALIDDFEVDVVTGGEYLFAGQPLVVTKDEKYRRVVRLLDPEPDETSDS